MDLYDSGTNSFALSASVPAMNDARYRASSAVLPNGNVLIAGGTGPGHPGAAPALSSTELYDSKSNSFAAGPVMNQARTGSAGYVSDSRSQFEF